MNLRTLTLWAFLIIVTFLSILFLIVTEFPANLYSIAFAIMAGIIFKTIVDEEGNP